jgi:alpha-galactosidase
LADKLIQVAKETGATYFKWDGVGAEICNDPRHWHGGAGDSPQERADSSSFQLVLRMNQIANRIAAAVPGAIVDFDMTERNRPMGLAFLSSGKYFLMNNGPYYQDYDFPIDKKNSNWNLFFHQGQARSWIARTPLGFDKWIPSILFMTHYFPDDPRQWQEVSVASLILGQNGIWGDLLGVSDSGVEYIGNMIRLYKQVRNDITDSDPIVTGIVSGSPEIHEKISSTTGRGVIVVFATAPGRFNYVSSHRVQPNHWASAGVVVAEDAQGRAKLNLTFDKPGAKIVFFGIHGEQKMQD